LIWLNDLAEKYAIRYKIAGTIGAGQDCLTLREAFNDRFARLPNDRCMILQEFPDIGWLKNQIANGFVNRRGWGNLSLDTAGFPSVIIHASTRGCYRPDVKGPFSLFLNIRGNSLCTVEGHTRSIDEAHFFISNRSQSYTFQVEEGPVTRRGAMKGPATGKFATKTPAIGKIAMETSGTETFNIHFGEHFAESILHALVTPEDRILEAEGENQSEVFSFFNQLQHRTPDFDARIRAIRQSYREQGFDKLLFEEQLAGLMSHLLLQHRHVLDQVNKLPVVSRSTRIELYRRLSRAVDYIHSSPVGEISLEGLSAEACLSKFHFLRLFRSAIGLSPHQYIQQMRLEKARLLLSQSSMPVAELAELLGFANSQSFSRLFFQRMGVYPSQYRSLIK
jgi:AraC family transcriptional regulator